MPPHQRLGAPRTTLRRSLVLAVATGLTGTLLPLVAVAPAQAAPEPGSAGSGDSILPGRGNGGYDVQRYVIRLSWKHQRRRIAGTTRIEAVATQDLSAFNLELHGLNVRSVSVGGVPAVDWDRSGDELTVTPAAAIAKGDRFRTVVAYDGRPGAMSDPRLGRTGWLPTGDGGTTMSEPIGSETWFPVNSTVRDKARYLVVVDAPKHLKVAGNGRLAGRKVGKYRTTWRWQEARPMSPYLAMISIGRYRMYRSKAGGVPAITFVDRKLGREKASRRTLPRVMRFLRSKLGPYPFATTGMVIDRVDVNYALETQGRPVLPGGRPPSWLITHEIAHQWLGNSVTPRDWKHIWLNEGLATYMEWLWDAHRYDAPRIPRQQFNFLYGTYRKSSWFWKTPPGNPGSADQLFAAPVYERGAMAVHALRMRVGDRAFFRILRAWAQNKAHSTVATRDLKNLAERISGKQLDRLFRRWVFAPRKPTGY